MRIILPAFFLLITFSLYSQTTDTKKITDTDLPKRDDIHLGLISKMVRIKGISEKRLEHFLLINDSTYLATFDEDLTKERKKELIKEKRVIDNAIKVAYNELSMEIDRFLLQLIMDMQQKNQIKPYRKINRYYKKKFTFRRFEKKYPEFKEQLVLIDKRFATFRNASKLPEEINKAVGIEELAAVAENSIAIWELIRDIKGKKVESITVGLTALRLLTPKEILEGAKKEAKKEEAKE